MAGYGDNTGFTAWATAAGHTVPSGDVAAARQRGSVYIDAVYGDRFTGTPTGGVEQERAWPRTGATAYGQTLASDLVPNRVVLASYEAALRELASPGILTPDYVAGSQVKREKVGSIEIEYAGANNVADARPVITAIEGLLSGLLVQHTPYALVV